MICIYNKETNPYFNLAAEEYVMKNFADELFMLWRNGPSVIIGKFQNALAEINTEFVSSRNISVVRRMTGGGAVFHDLGNLNFTFVKNGQTTDFKGFTQPILSALRSLGVPACFQGRNDLTINGMKISGNAECVTGGKTLHHGTLLFSAQMDYLAEALKVNPLKFQDKAVKSVRKRVANIADYLSEPMSVTDFAEYIMKFVGELYPDSKQYVFNEHDYASIRKLQKEKYETWDWNYGTSPDYTFSKTLRTNGGLVEAQLNLVKSHIETISFWGDFFAQKDIGELENLLKGAPHRREDIVALLQNVEVGEYMLNVTSDDILNLLF